MTLDQFAQEFGSEAESIVDSVVFAMFDTCHCPRCGSRSKLRGQVYQTVLKGAIVYACKDCDSLVSEFKEEIPF